MAGKIVSLHPGIAVRTQHPGWKGRRWRYEGSVLDSVGVAAADAPKGPLKVLVTLGTIRPYRFDRLIRAVEAILDTSDSVTWQVGSTAVQNLPGRVVTEMTEPELRAEMAGADVVVTHAGVGSILLAHSVGKVPVIAPRSAAFKEHVDEHQSSFSASIRERHLALTLPLDGTASRSTLIDAASKRVISPVSI